MGDMFRQQGLPADLVSGNRRALDRVMRDNAQDSQGSSKENIVVHPGARDWQAALQEAGIPANASNSDIAAAVNELGLDWWFVGATGFDLLNNSVKFYVARVWEGVGSDRPNALSENPLWDGYSEQSRDEALGIALRKYFSTL